MFNLFQFSGLDKYFSELQDPTEKIQLLCRQFEDMQQTLKAIKILTMPKSFRIHLRTFWAYVPVSAIRFVKICGK